MDSAQLVLLIQLITNLKANYALLENSFNSSDKESFDNYKKVLLELQFKIDYLLKQK